MNVILSGFSHRNELAFDFFLKRFLTGWHWTSVPGSREVVFPTADVLLIDLAACGWAQHNELAQAQLVKAVGNQVAVLLVSAQDRSWADTPSADKKDAWIWLAKPYGSEGMRDALTRAAELLKGKQRSVSPVAPADAKPVLAKVISSVAVLQPLQGPIEELRQTPDPVPEHALSPADLAARLVNLPPERYLLLRKLSAGLHLRQPFEVRFTVHNSLIVHPVDAWVATNTPLLVILRVCASDALAASVTLRDIDADQVEERVHRLGMMPHDLNVFLFDMVAATLPPVL
jgi:hypothetical protein